MMPLAENNKSLIVGAYGFVGLHLARTLLKLGHHVILFGRRSEGSTIEVAQLKKDFPDRLECEYGEIIPELHQKFVHDHDGEIGYIYHLAARKVHSQMEGMEIGSLLSYNYDMDIEVFDVAETIAEKRPVHLLYVSSAEVYGARFEGINTQIYEEDTCYLNPRNAKHVYPASKLGGEMMLQFGGWGFRWSIARLQNPIGPRMGEKLFIPKVMKAAVDGVPFFIGADDSRPYVYVEDACDAFVQIVEHPLGHGHTFNVAAERSYRNSEVVEAIGKLVGVPMQLQVPEKSEPTNRNVSVEKVVSLIGWRQRIHLEEGLRRTWAHYWPRFAAEKSMGAINI